MKLLLVANDGEVLETILEDVEEYDFSKYPAQNFVVYELNMALGRHIHNYANGRYSDDEKNLT